MKSNLNLRQIEAFRSVMVAGTVVGAAKLMNVTQPGVSRSIGLLELRIGYALFERRGRRLVPTPEAEALYREIEPLYGSLDRIAQIAQDIKYQRAGALRIGTLPALAQSVVPRGVARFLAARPQVKVYVESLPSRQIAELVSSRQFDLGVVELPLSRPAITIEPLDPMPMVVVIPTGHRLAAKRQVSLKDLDGERTILLSQHSVVRYQMDDAFSSLGVAPNVVLETPSSVIACALVAAGAGITLVAKPVPEPFVGTGLVVRPVKEDLASRCALIFPDSMARMQLAAAFAEDFREEFKRSL